MTLNSVIGQLDFGKAAKRPCMRGYVYLKDMNPVADAGTEEEVEAEVKKATETAFALVDRDGNETVFTDGEDAKCILDKSLFECLAADDWEIADRDAYEKARVGDGRW